MKIATSPPESHPLFPSNPPVEVEVLSSPPFLKIWLEVQPPSRKWGININAYYRNGNIYRLSSTQLFDRWSRNISPLFITVYPLNVGFDQFIDTQLVCLQCYISLPLKPSENPCFSGFMRGYRNLISGANGLSLNNELCKHLMRPNVLIVNWLPSEWCLTDNLFVINDSKRPWWRKSCKPHM